MIITEHGGTCQNVFSKTFSQVKQSMEISGGCAANIKCFCCFTAFISQQRGASCPPPTPYPYQHCYIPQSGKKGVQPACGSLQLQWLSDGSCKQGCFAPDVLSLAHLRVCLCVLMMMAELGIPRNLTPVYSQEGWYRLCASKKFLHKHLSRPGPFRGTSEC